MNSNMKPKVSVVMSVYNGERYLHESIKSILNQTYKNFEFIIINDGSTDRSLEIIRSYTDDRMVLINQENTGLAKALNNGIAISKSDYIARMDADDVAMPERLEKQVDFLSKNLNCTIVGSNASVIDKDGYFVRDSNLSTTNDEMKRKLPSTPFIHPSVMFRKNIFYKAGQYPEYMLNAQDVVLFNSMAKYGTFANLSENLIQYRIVPTANTGRDKKVSEKFNKILSKAIKYNKISDDDFAYLKTKTNSNRNSKERLANYHLYLAKKYLWNNYQPKLTRSNLIKSLSNKFNFICVFYYFVSFMPNIVIKSLYEHLKCEKC